MKSVYKILMFVTVLSGFVSCKEIIISDGGSDAWYSNMKLNYDWNIYEDSSKTEMCLVTSRLINTRHNYFITDSDAKYLAKRPYESLPDTINPNLPLNSDSTMVRMESGEYAMFLVSTLKDKVEVKNMGDFLNTPETVGLVDMEYYYKSMKKEDFPKIGGVNWVSSSDYETFYNAGICYFSHADYVEIADDKRDFTVDFKMDMLTQKVNFDFDIEIEQDDDHTLYIKDIAVELSGIIKGMNLYTGHLDYEDYGKMFMDGKLKNTSADVKPDSYRYSGFINSLGLIEGDDYSSIAGPGVMRVGLYIEIYDKNNSLYSKRILFAMKNISEEIKNAELTEFENNIILKQKRKSADIKISDKLMIDAKTVIKGTGGGVTGWDESYIDGNV